MTAKNLSWVRTAVLMGSLVATVQAVAPPLRDQILLNGTWPTGGQVPVYEGINSFATKTYERSVPVDPSWSGKTIKLDCYGINYYVEVYVDNRHVADNLTPFGFFSMDLTDYVRPGGAFQLRLQVRGSSEQPVSNAQGQVLWPIGWGGRHHGIIDDIYLRAYGGKVAIEDAFVQTSFRNKTIKVDYTLKNYDNVSHTVTVTGDAVAAPGVTPPGAITVTTSAVTLAAGGTQTVSVTAPWQNPSLWMPHDPKLYHMVSRVTEGTTELDRETRRFGFREMWIVGAFFYLNGVRCNFRGENVVWHEAASRTANPDAWAALVTDFKDTLNFNCFRSHMSPCRQHHLEHCDETGFMVFDESALYGNSRYISSPHQEFLNNIRGPYTSAWLKGHRNHPSIVIWSAMNESWFWNLTVSERISIGAAMKAVDPTRVVIYDGDGGRWAQFDDDPRTETVSQHYPEGYQALPPNTAGAIYDWSWCRNASRRPFYPKPWGSGEFLACCWSGCPMPGVYYWQGTWVRGLRYQGMAEIRPYKMSWERVIPLLGGI